MADESNFEEFPKRELVDKESEYFTVSDDAVMGQQSFSMMSWAGEPLGPAIFAEDVGEWDFISWEEPPPATP